MRLRVERVEGVGSGSDGWDFFFMVSFLSMIMDSGSDSRIPFLFVSGGGVVS